MHMFWLEKVGMTEIFSEIPYIHCVLPTFICACINTISIVSVEFYRYFDGYPWEDKRVPTTHIGTTCIVESLPYHTLATHEQKRNRFVHKSVSLVLFGRTVPVKSDQVLGVHRFRQNEKKVWFLFSPNRYIFFQNYGLRFENHLL